jgi:hypothetical protein
MLLLSAFECPFSHKPLYSTEGQIGEKGENSLPVTP